jgi:hypothetical protein
VASELVASRVVLSSLELVVVNHTFESRNLGGHRTGRIEGIFNLRWYDGLGSIPGSLLSNGYRGKRPGREIDHSLLSIVEVKNVGAYTPIPLILSGTALHRPPTVSYERQQIQREGEIERERLAFYWSQLSRIHPETLSLGF